MINDDIEKAAKICEDMRPAGGRMWSTEQQVCWECLTNAAKNIRELKEENIIDYIKSFIFSSISGLFLGGIFHGTIFTTILCGFIIGCLGVYLTWVDRKN